MRLLIAATLTVTLVACSHGAREAHPLTPEHNSDVLTADDFTGVRGATLYDAVQQLRPVWIMRSRPNPVVRSQGDVIIYVDGARYGSGIDGLRTLALRAVGSARYYSAVDATARFGPGHLLGAIEVTTVPR